MQSDADETKLPLIEKALATEQNASIKDQLGMVRAAALLGSTDQGTSAWKPPNCWRAAARPIPKPCCWRAWSKKPSPM